MNNPLPFSEDFLRFMIVCSMAFSLAFFGLVGWIIVMIVKACKKPKDNQG